MSALTKEQRDKLPSDIYGLPDIRKFPMPDMKHVVLARRFSKYAPEGRKEELMAAIERRTKELTKTALDYSALTGGAYGAIGGGAIGAYAASADLPNKSLNKKQKLALILAGALAGSSAGASIGATPMRRQKTARVSIRNLVHRLKALWSGNRLEDYKLRRYYTNRVRRGYNLMEEVEKTSAYVSPKVLNKLTARLESQADVLPKDKLLSRLNRLINKETVQDATFKYSPKHQFNKFTERLDLDPKRIAKSLPGAIASGAKDSASILSGALITKFVDKLLTKNPTKLQQFIDATPKYLAGATAVAAGTYAGSKLAGFKFNPSVLMENTDDIMDAYIMYKAQQKQIAKERAAYNSKQRDK